MFMFSPSVVLSKPNEQGFEFLKHLQGCHKGKNLKGVHQLKQYLEKFGYLHYEKHSAHAKDDEFDELLESAVKTYQLNYHLNVSGSLDSQTVNQMIKPRCGVPDIINGTTRMQSGKKKHQHGPLSLHTVSHFSFFPNAPRWPADKTHLTYRFRSSVQVVPPQTLRPVISSAFAKWAAVSKFTFAEAQPGFNSDIEIGFHRGSHGDNEPFDGRGTTLAHAFAPPIGLFHYDADESWSTNPTPNTLVFDLESLAVHEIGHLLGLGHSEERNAIMFSSIESGSVKRDLHADDIQGIQTLYNI
ncbi:Metalloendoproteinase 5-mmp [Thalictrum thalictroides]|uniref:Metalloendoproteinase 5-mmp n=1 Tax=Thalictrum thalictroides TaxID=46969 RepID=A0A7J6VK54_THATH|nr:Metalloendoproteinase 5-mmp [Thalictrum thalictroides]